MIHPYSVIKEESSILTLRKAAHGTADWRNRQRPDQELERWLNLPEKQKNELENICREITTKKKKPFFCLFKETEESKPAGTQVKDGDDDGRIHEGDPQDEDKPFLLHLSIIISFPLISLLMKTH